MKYDARLVYQYDDRCRGHMMGSSWRKKPIKGKLLNQQMNNQSSGIVN